MGRLLDPGLGELVDRLTILQLKVICAPVSTSVEHFQQELSQLHMRLERAHITEPIRQGIADLRIANAALWALEDRMAAYAASEAHWDGTIPYLVARYGVEIWRTNRKRNQIIHEINRLAGTDRGPEKL